MGVGAAVISDMGVGVGVGGTSSGLAQRQVRLARIRQKTMNVEEKNLLKNDFVNESLFIQLWRNPRNIR